MTSKQKPLLEAVERRLKEIIQRPDGRGEAFLGVDPGAGGGLAFVNSYEDVEATAMPATPRDMWDWISAHSSASFAVIEKVQGYIGVGHPGSGMFKFGVNFGLLLMALTVVGIPFEEVTPQKWQKGMSISGRRRNESKTAWKNRLKTKAQQIYPKVKVTLAVSDALLIATFCKRKHEGTL